MSTDRIEKIIVLDAPRSRVWRAISDAEEFGKWFGVDLEGPFAPGETVHGRITLPGYEHLTMDVMVDKLEPERLLSFRWVPHVMDPDADTSGEPTTLVEFRLDEVPEGTRLTLTESGFDAIPDEHRKETFIRNEQGWTEQMKNIEKHVA